MFVIICQFIFTNHRTIIIDKEYEIKLNEWMGIEITLDWGMNIDGIKIMKMEEHRSVHYR